MQNMNDIDGLLAELRRQVRTNRLTIDESFRDFDRLRKGVIPEAQFAAAVGSLKWPRMALQKQHIDMLCNHYVVEDPIHGTRTVPYQRFCDDMNELSVLRDLERDPDLVRTLPAATVGGTLGRSTGGQALTPQEQALFDQVQAFYVQQTISRGLYNSLKEAFSDFDKHFCGRVSASRFHRCFPFNVDEKTIGIIIKRYTDPATGDVNYLAWVKDIESTVEAEQPGLSSAQGTRTLGSTVPKGSPLFGSTQGTRSGRIVRGGDLVTAEQVEQAIIDLCFARRIRIHEPFRDFDPRRCGTITRGQFASALTVCDIILDGDELDALCEKYRAEDVAANGPKVRWLEFADYVDSVFTTKGLERAPTGFVPGATASVRSPLR
jgi:Ca2+-binding EF-hand superfamily protein